MNNDVIGDKNDVKIAGGDIMVTNINPNHLSPEEKIRIIKDLYCDCNELIEDEWDTLKSQINDICAGHMQPNYHDLIGKSYPGFKHLTLSKLKEIYDENKSKLEEKERQIIRRFLRIQHRGEMYDPNFKTPDLDKNTGLDNFKALFEELLHRNQLKDIVDKTPEYHDHPDHKTKILRDIGHDIRKKDAYKKHKLG